MKRSIIFAMLILTLSTMGCKKSIDNNNSLEFDIIDVNFAGAVTDRSWSEGEEIGIFSTSTHNDELNVPMSVNANARYTTRMVGEEVYFSVASDNDRIIASAKDHNFKFYTYFPYSNTNTDRVAIQAQVPSTQYYSLGVENYGLYVSIKEITTVVPTVKLDFKAIFSTVELYLPNDILDDNGNSIIRSLTLRPAIPGNFNGTLADGGTFNLETGVFRSNDSMQGNSVQIDFGEGGITLVDAFTKVSLAVSPFAIPLGGMDVVIRDLSGNEKRINIFGEEKDKGTILAAGKVLTQYLSNETDGIIPVTFPVVFPLGKINGIATFTPLTQPLWVSKGVWTSPAQTQAYSQWHKVSDPSTTIFQVLEIIGSGEISSLGVKGIWTGDYLEFVLPVKKFSAGTTVTIKFPMYTRQGPVFWNIEYLDGETWKSNKTNLTSYDPDYTRQATFSLIRGGKDIEHSMVFTQAIESGNIKVRITCADGTIQADTDTKVAVRNTPWVSGSVYAAPFYLFRENSDLKSVSFSVN